MYIGGSLHFCFRIRTRLLSVRSLCRETERSLTLTPTPPCRKDCYFSSSSLISLFSLVISLVGSSLVVGSSSRLGSASLASGVPQSGSRLISVSSVSNSGPASLGSAFGVHRGRSIGRSS